MRLSATYNVPAYKRFLSQQKSKNEIAFRAGIAAQVTAITEAVPVFSGESRASFTEAARLARVPLFVIPVPGVKSKVAEGRSQGTARLTLSAKTFSFEIDSSVLQLRINDEFDATVLHPNFRLKKPGPYNLNTIGNEAFLTETKHRLRAVRYRVERRTIKNG